MFHKQVKKRLFHYISSKIAYINKKISLHSEDLQISKNGGGKGI
jgi:hypothetical protein